MSSHYYPCRQYQYSPGFDFDFDLKSTGALALTVENLSYTKNARAVTYSIVPVAFEKDKIKKGDWYHGTTLQHLGNGAPR